jgi:predicted transcriptional regulator
MELDHQKLNNDLFILIKTIFHYERIFYTKFKLKIEEVYVLEILRKQEVVRVTIFPRSCNCLCSISAACNRLVEDGHISKRQDLVDRRNFFLHLTEKGKEVLSAVENYSFERISTNVKYLKEYQVKELLHLAEQLHIILGVTEEVFHPQDNGRS